MFGFSVDISWSWKCHQVHAVNMEDPELTCAGFVLIGGTRVIDFHDWVRHFFPFFRRRQSKSLPPPNGRLLFSPWSCSLLAGRLKLNSVNRRAGSCSLSAVPLAVEHLIGWGRCNDCDASINLFPALRFYQGHLLHGEWQLLGRTNSSVVYFCVKQHIVIISLLSRDGITLTKERWHYSWCLQCALETRCSFTRGKPLLSIPFSTGRICPPPGGTLRADLSVAPLLIYQPASRSSFRKKWAKEPITPFWGVIYWACCFSHFPFYESIAFACTRGPYRNLLDCSQWQSNYLLQSRLQGFNIFQIAGRQLKILYSTIPHRLTQRPALLTSTRARTMPARL